MRFSRDSLPAIHCMWLGRTGSVLCARRLTRGSSSPRPTSSSVAERLGVRLVLATRRKVESGSRWSESNMRLVMVVLSAKVVSAAERSWGAGEVCAQPGRLAQIFVLCVRTAAQLWRHKPGQRRRGRMRTPMSWLILRLILAFSCWIRVSERLWLISTVVVAPGRRFQLKDSGVRRSMVPEPRALACFRPRRWYLRAVERV